MESKRAKVIMLPTEYNLQPNIIYRLVEKQKGDLILINDNMVGIYKGNNILQPQHLHIITEDRIKNNDLVYCNNFGVEQIVKCFIYDGVLYIDVKDEEEKFSRVTVNKFDKKVIATTDKSLFESISLGTNEDMLEVPINYEDVKEVIVKNPLPQPSQAFIKKYCKLGGIDEVLVEYETIKRNQTEMELAVLDNDYNVVKSFLPKVDSHNTITIHPIKTTWDRNETKELMWLTWKAANVTFEDEGLREQFEHWYNTKGKNL